MEIFPVLRMGVQGTLRYHDYSNNKQQLQLTDITHTNVIHISVLNYFSCSKDS